MLSESAELPRGLQDLQLGSLRILTGGEKGSPRKTESRLREMANSRIHWICPWILISTNS